MPTHCPFCAAPLAATGDAFCGECRGQLDEAPPLGVTPADLEMLRKISTGNPAYLTTLDLMICLFLPLIGLIVGGKRQARGEPSAGRMLRLSAVMLVAWVVLRILLASSVRSE